MKDFNPDFMELAARLSYENIDNGGGPFGAVVVRDGKIIATGVNRVTANNDPTAHAEVSAIRVSCKKLKTFRHDSLFGGNGGLGKVDRHPLFPGSEHNGRTAVGRHFLWREQSAASLREGCHKACQIVVGDKSCPAHKSPSCMFFSSGE